MKLWGQENKIFYISLMVFLWKKRATIKGNKLFYGEDAWCANIWIYKYSFNARNLIHILNFQCLSVILIYYIRDLDIETLLY